MNAFTRDDFVTWMERLARLPWPMTLEAFTDLAPELGWHFTGYQYSFTADFAAGTRKVVVIDNKAGDVHTISFVLAKPALEGVELLAELNDFFSGYASRLGNLGIAHTDSTGKKPRSSVGSPASLHRRDHQKRREDPREVSHTSRSKVLLDNPSLSSPASSIQ